VIVLIRQSQELPCRVLVGCWSSSTPAG